MLDIDIFDQGIENLKQNFPDAIFTQYKYDIWLEKLETTLSNEEFEIAVREAIFKLRFCPTGEELISLVKGSEKELVLDCWAKTLDALSRRLSLNDLDDASQYAIAQLGGVTHLGELPIYELHRLKPDFCTHWQAYRKDPKDFKRPTQTIPPEQREYTPPEVEASITPEQLAKNAELRKQMLAAVAFNKKLNGGKTNAN